MIIVTGASKGIGFAIASSLSNQGIEVLGISRSKILDSPFPTIACDVSDFQGLKEIARTLKGDSVPVNGLVNAAGIASMNLAILSPESTVRKLIDTNLIGTIFASQVFTPLMIRSGGGRIINFSTIAVAIGLEGESIYAASKAGVEGFTRSFAREVYGHKITANCIAPGPISTNLISGVPAEKINEIVSRQISKTMHTVEDVVDLVELLLDKRSFTITGQVLNVGGY